MLSLRFLLIRTEAVEGDDDEADERQDERYVDGRMIGDGVLVDNHSLQRWHQSSANNRHHQEGSTQMRVLRIDILQSDTVNGGEHQRHEETDANERIQSQLTYDENKMVSSLRELTYFIRNVEIKRLQRKRLIATIL